MNRFWDEYPAIQRDLECVAEIMKKEVKCYEKSIEKSLLELINSGGKLLRPGFLLLSGGFGNYNSKTLFPLAAVIEMLHMATLIHDDIVDDSSHRRGSETIQAKYGKNYAVFMGDFLFRFRQDVNPDPCRLSCTAPNIKLTFITHCYNNKINNYICQILQNTPLLSDWLFSYNFSYICSY